MHKIIVLCVFIMALVMIGECIELPGGQSQSITGQGSAGNAAGQQTGQPPAFTYPPGSFSAGRTNTINLQVPTVNIPANRNKESNQSTTTGGETGTSTTLQSLAFTMTSDVKGSGNFAVSSFLEGHGYDNKAYQLFSSVNGSLTQSRNIKFIQDRKSGASTDVGTMSYELAKIDVQDSTLFSGSSYNDVTKLNNHEDLIQDVTNARAIAKNSAYGSQSFSLAYDNETSTEGLVNNYLAYKIDTNFVGSSSLHAVTNGTDIMQSYIGRIRMNRTIADQSRVHETTAEDTQLECCKTSSFCCPQKFDTSDL
jgi:hypothetical protein